MSLDPNTLIEQSPRTAARVIDGKAVVIVIDDKKLHTLNETGTLVWEGATRRSLSEIADEIVESYEGVEAEAVLRDVTTFAEQLLSLGALRVVPR